VHASAGATHRLFFALWPDDEVRRAITAHHARLADVQAELDAAYARWTELEDE
jgi:hypothetical protein